MEHDSSCCTTHNTVQGDVIGQSIMVGTINGDVHQHAHSRLVAKLPYRAGIAPPQAGFFQRRQVLFPVGGEARTTVLMGLGGVGKTQLALDHAETAWSAGEVDLLVWVTAGSRAAVVSTYASLAADLTGIEDPDPERAARRFLEWLANSQARWLLVFDDVQRPADMHGLWPVGTNGRVVVTTRRQGSAMRGAGRWLIEVNVFTSAESASYLRGALVGHDQLAEDADELGEDLGHLPLALAQAGAYMIDRSLSCAEYRKRFADRRRKLTTLFPDLDDLPDGHQATVATTWSLSVELADQLTPAGLARPLLALASLLDPNGIPGEVFGSPSVLRYLKLVTGREVSVEDGNDGLGCLHRLSLISFDMRSSGRVVRVHQLVQWATRDDITSGQLKQVTHVAAGALRAIWPPEFHDAVLGQTLRANTDALEAATSGLLWECGCRDLLFTAAISCGHSGAVAAAHEKFVRLTETAENKLGPDHPSALRARRYSARWTGELGDTTRAVAMYQALVHDVERVLGRSDKETLGSRNDLAFWRSKDGDLEGALSEFMTLIADQIAALGFDHLDTLNTRSNIARVLGECGRAGDAVTAFAKLMPDLCRVLGSDHVLTLTSRHNLAHWRGKNGDPRGAVAELRAVLADRERVLGVDHPHSFSTRSTLARWRGWTGDPRGAATDLAAVVAERIRVFGETHTETLDAMWEIGCWWIDARDLTRAVASYESLLVVLDRAGDEHDPLRDIVLAQITACRRAM